jgi:hypothetical protein
MTVGYFNSTTIIETVKSVFLVYTRTAIARICYTILFFTPHNMANSRSFKQVEICDVEDGNGVCSAERFQV